MFFKVFLFSTLFSTSLWYFHEYHPSTFMLVMRNIPYLSPVIARLHSRDSKSTLSENAKLFTKEELSEYDGQHEHQPIYIAILGDVFDVTKGKKHYEKSGTYSIFAGRDSSRSFITGDFSIENASDDILELSPQDLIGLRDWKEFYFKDYTHVGKLVGRFYDENGDKTEYYHKVEGKLEEGLGLNRAKSEEKRKFPSCNVEWSKDRGSHIWCTNKSGGVDREWTGVPRKLFEVGSTSFRCVCVNLDFLNDPNSVQYSKRSQLREYEGCDSKKTDCYMKN